MKDFRIIIPTNEGTAKDAEDVSKKMRYYFGENVQYCFESFVSDWPYLAVVPVEIAVNSHTRKLWKENGTQFVLTGISEASKNILESEYGYTCFYGTLIEEGTEGGPEGCLDQCKCSEDYLLNEDKIPSPCGKNNSTRVCKCSVNGKEVQLSEEEEKEISDMLEELKESFKRGSFFPGIPFLSLLFDR